MQLLSLQQMNGVTAYQWDQDGNVATTSLPSGTSIPLTVTDKLMIVKLSAGTSNNPIKVTLASNVPGGWISVDGAPIGVGSILNWKRFELLTGGAVGLIEPLLPELKRRNPPQRAARELNQILRDRRGAVDSLLELRRSQVEKTTHDKQPATAKPQQPRLKRYWNERLSE